jgi:hypothetical protein
MGRLLTGHGPSAGTARTPPLLVSAENRAQRQRPKGVVIDRSEREGAVAESLFRATLAARSGGRRWLESRIGSAGRMSARCAQSEMLSWLELGCMRVAHRWVACEASDHGQQPCVHPGAVESVAQATKAAKQWHSRATSVWEILCGPD